MNNYNEYEIPEFDYKKFKEEFNKGDIWGLEYMEKTIIRDFKDRINDNIEKYTYYDYILGLFYAAKCLNSCNDIYEVSDVKNNFNWEYYANIRDLLFKELGIEV